MAREPSAKPVHLRPHAPVAERVLAPGDPGRALRLAQALLQQPKMLNHHRGLWGYTGTAADGAPLTIQSTGVGGPSAAIVVDDLASLGARRLVRVGTAVALDAALRLGDLVAATRVAAGDGTSRALGAPPALAPDPALAAALAAVATRSGGVYSADVPSGDDAAALAADALVRDLQSAAVLAAARRRGAAVAAILLVVCDAAGVRLDDVDALHAAELALGRAGAAALAV